MTKVHVSPHSDEAMWEWDLRPILVHVKRPLKALSNDKKKMLKPEIKKQAMAVSYVSSFFSALLPSKSSCQRPTYRHCLPSQLQLPQISSGWSPLVSGVDPTVYPSSLSSLSASDYSPIVYPALAYSNILYFKSAYNVQIIVGENEPEDKLLNRFRKEVLKAGVLQECKYRRFFENTHDKKKRKAREAARKNRKRRPQSRAPAQNKDEAPRKRKDDDEDDNWDLPDVDLPYC